MIGYVQRQIRSVGGIRLLAGIALLLGLHYLWRTKGGIDSVLDNSVICRAICCYIVLMSLCLLQQKAGPFPNIKSTHSLVAKHVTADKWAKLGGIKTKTSGFTLGQVMQTLMTRTQLRHIFLAKLQYLFPFLLPDVLESRSSNSNERTGFDANRQRP